MNANCIICADLFHPRSDIYATQCGHLFHFVCLVQWIERSKTCPQCRHKENEKTIHRVYFNITTTEHIPDDIVTLQAKLDNENFQVKIKDKEKANLYESYKKCNANSRTLSDLTLNLQKKSDANKKAMVNMKEQLRFYRDKIKDKEKCAAEVIRLKSHIENMKHLRTVIDGCQEEVDDIFKGSRDPKTLCLFVAVLQKELTEQDRKKQKLQKQLASNKADYNQVRAEAFVLKKKYEELKTAKEEHQTCPAKITSLKEKLASVLEQNKNINANDSINRAIFESPAPLRPNFNEAFVDVDAIESPSVAERVAQIKASDSPYLTIKSTVGGNYGNLLQAKYKIQPKGASNNASGGQNTDKYSIFSKKLAAGPSKGEYSYNGLGGHSKEELFPQPKNNSFSLKRSKPSSVNSNSKFKKLNPNAVSLFNMGIGKK